ncbi:MAG: polymer-forming cytoskeletal protein [Pseudomonadota bacterium]
MIEIAESGIFKGHAEIDSAEIAGRYEGNLTVRDRLYVRATGKVVGTVRYGRLEIECGGELVGDVQVLSRPVVAPAAEPATTAEPV